VPDWSIDHIWSQCGQKNSVPDIFDVRNTRVDWQFGQAFGPVFIAGILTFSLARVPQSRTPNCAAIDLRGILRLLDGTFLVLASSVGAEHFCPKCGSHRTRAVGTITAATYQQCDACEYLFRLSVDEGMSSKPSLLAATIPPVCPKCGTNRTRIVGQSETPPLVHRQCEGCGHLSSRALNGEGL
jgi:Zn finger protein HypA/HybF involved in hydrogenase expression